MSKFKLVQLVAGIITLVLLPSVAVGASSAAIAILADLEVVNAIPGLREAEMLGDKSVSYWFIALAAIAILSWTWIVKWLIHQLEQQRTANAELTKSLVEYLAKDHAGTLQALTQNSLILERVVDKLKTNQHES